MGLAPVQRLAADGRKRFIVERRVRTREVDKAMFASEVVACMVYPRGSALVQTTITMAQLAVEMSDPLRMARIFWPNNKFYKEQQEIIYSTENNDETVVPAGNMLGKDYVAGYIALRHFLKAGIKSCRIVTTSVKDDHLRVLWGEIGRFITTSVIPLTADKGGPLVYNHRQLRKLVNGQIDDISYCIGQVSERGEGMAGHHAEFTLGIIDEASGVDDLVYTQMCTWAKRILIIGNPNPCPPTQFFHKAVIEGDLVDPSSL